MIPFSLKFSRIKYFVVLPTSVQKQNFTDKIFMVDSCTNHALPTSYRPMQHNAGKGNDAEFVTTVRGYHVNKTCGMPSLNRPYLANGQHVRLQAIDPYILYAVQGSLDKRIQISLDGITLDSQ